MAAALRFTLTARGLTFRGFALRSTAVGRILLGRAALVRIVLLGPFFARLTVGRLLIWLLALLLGGAGPFFLAGTPRFLIGRGLIAGAAARFGIALLTRLRAALLILGLGSGRSFARLIGVLTAALLSAAGTIARRVALRVGLLGANAGRLGRIGFLTRVLARLAGLLLLRRVALLRRRRAALIVGLLAGAG